MSRKPVRQMGGRYQTKCSAAEVFRYFRQVHLGSRADFRTFPHDTSYVLRRLRVAVLTTPVSDDNATARAYARRSTPFPPIILRCGDVVPIDGKHRLAAARLRGQAWIRAYVSVARARHIRRAERVAQAEGARRRS